LPFVCEHRFWQNRDIGLASVDDKIPQLLAAPVFSMNEEWVSELSAGMYNKPLCTVASQMGAARASPAASILSAYSRQLRTPSGSLPDRLLRIPNQWQMRQSSRRPRAAPAQIPSPYGRAFGLTSQTASSISLRLPAALSAQRSTVLRRISKVQPCYSQPRVVWDRLTGRAEGGMPATGDRGELMRQHVKKTRLGLVHLNGRHRARA